MVPFIYNLYTIYGSFCQTEGFHYNHLWLVYRKTQNINYLFLDLYVIYRSILQFNTICSSRLVIMSGDEFKSGALIIPYPFHSEFVSKQRGYRLHPPFQSKCAASSDCPENAIPFPGEGALRVRFLFCHIRVCCSLGLLLLMTHRIVLLDIVGPVFADLCRPGSRCPEL